LKGWEVWRSCWQIGAGLGWVGWYFTPAPYTGDPRARRPTQRVWQVLGNLGVSYRKRLGRQDALLVTARWQRVEELGKPTDADAVQAHAAWLSTRNDRLAIAINVGFSVGMDRLGTEPADTPDTRWSVTLGGLGSLERPVAPVSIRVFRWLDALVVPGLGWSGADQRLHASLLLGVDLHWGS